MAATPLRHCRTRRPERTGNIVVLATVLMIVMLAFVAFAVDIGYLMLARTELQRSADAAALAATWDLIEQIPASERVQRARLTASDYVGHNKVCSAAPKVRLNTENSPDGDIVVGEFVGRNEPLTFSDPDQFNAVRVRVRRDGDLNEEVPHFFAHVFGQSSAALQAEATAAIVTNISGFRFPSDDQPNIPLLPITLHEDTWNGLLTNTVMQDEWSWDASDNSVIAGGDSKPECILYPASDDSPGNFGTVNIGTSANATSHLSAQILNGVSQADLDYHGGELVLEDNGTVTLGGDTGISTGIKDDLLAIRGLPRIIPIYGHVAGNGDNAVYTVVKFVGIRIMEVKLTGQDKRIVIQPANVVTSSAIPSASGQTSDFVFSPSRLVE